MDDDLAIPQALGVLHDRVRAGNAALDDEDLALAAQIRGEVTAMTEVLGINPHSPEWRSTVSAPSERALGALVQRLIEDREAARGSRDFAAADRIRNELAAAGITVEDSPNGTHWSIEP
jgi:cysteinyl-tRNA synthetase